MHSRREYSLLASEETEGGRASAGPRVRGDGHGATWGTAEEGRTDTETGVRTGKRALLAHGIQEDRNEERPPPTSCARLMCATTQGGKEWGDPSPGSTCLRRTSRGWRGTPGHGSARTKRAATRGRKRGDPPPSSTRKPCAGRGTRGPPQPGRALPQHAAKENRRG